MLRTISAVALCCTALTAACARSASQTATPASAMSSTATVAVNNQRFYDMDIFVSRGGGDRVRLGTVSGNSSARFTIPAYVVGPGTMLRFVADPIGPSGVSRSEELNVQPGDAVQLTITP